MRTDVTKEINHVNRLGNEQAGKKIIISYIFLATSKTAQ